MFQTDISDGALEEMSREAEARRGGDSVRGKCVGPWKVFALRTRILVEQKTQGEYQHPEDTKELLIIVLYFELLL